MVTGEVRVVGDGGESQWQQGRLMTAAEASSDGRWERLSRAGGQGGGGSS